MTQKKDAGILAVDVGSGTQDILVWDPETTIENCTKMVVPSATRILARRIEKETLEGRHIFLTGTTMGGGPCAAAVRRHLRAGLRVFALPKAALTFHDNLDKVREMGVEVVRNRPSVSPLSELVMRDMDLEAVGAVLERFGVSLPPMIAVAVQDHGFSPNASNRRFRFSLWSDLLAAGTGLEGMLYADPPPHLTRMLAVKEQVPRAWVMDTGAAAMLGALLDPWISQRLEQGVTVINIGNEHTVAALIKGSKLWGIYEHHTSLLSEEKLEDHLERFRRGRLSGEEVFQDMGHGCRVVEGTAEAGPFPHLGITGPKRGRFPGLGGHMAAPFGDMMLTGCFGLVEALQRTISACPKPADRV
ncbi:MAG: DUF1786 domain-containing protein [Deltaproteobacteria bacterium]|nr:DUF1786 domain-containing protein [Deltaproteobacteria bacterium]MBW1924460.1 DUF1786 domain-containing protein [Deltaproteobacteria bacterium]MBW1951132.1 DUF1786 domain-containing protein [Deltaproteobacteria bacterium]MBW2008735.1 DUF1786 domain-containing protein [Deltaproteobacteria bacterium]